MRRRIRDDQPGAIHHVMNRGINRQQVFFADVDRIEFGRRLADIHEATGTETLAYCLVDNHYHLLLRSVDGKLSAAMQRLGSIYTRHTNERLGRDGPLFRGRFHSIPVRTDAYLLTAFRYIHLNALDVRGVASAAEYRWSSLRSYLRLRRSPPFLNSGFVLDYFDHDVTELAAFHDAEARRTSVVATPHDLRALIDLAAADEDLRNGVNDEMPRSLERPVAALLGHSSATPGIARAAQLLATFPSDAARRMAVSRARRRLATDDSFRRVVETVEQHLAIPPIAA